MAKKRKYKVHWSIREKILAFLAILSFLLTIAGIVQKHWNTSESEPKVKSSKVEIKKNKNW